MIPDFLYINANHVEKDFLMDSINFVLYAVSIVALELLLICGFDSNDEKFLEYFQQHLLQGLMTWFDIHSLICSVKIIFTYVKKYKFQFVKSSLGLITNSHNYES